MSSYKNAWIQSYSGRKVYPLMPNMGDFSITDIAHSLSNQCRYLGHTRDFYSVAQHCVLASKIVPPQFALEGLLHDSGEAYLGDTPSPLKRTEMWAEYRDHEEWVLELIFRKFGLTWPLPPCVHRADRVLLSTEARDVMSPRHPDWIMPEEPPMLEVIVPMLPKEAEAAFLLRFDELYHAPKQWKGFI